MLIKVSENRKYSSVKIHLDGTTAETGLLNNNQAAKYVIEFINAAEDLLNIHPVLDADDFNEKLRAIRVAIEEA